MLQIDKDENNIAYIFEKSKNKKTADAISDKISYCETAGKNDFKSIDVDDPYYFALAPRPLKEKERMTLFVAGEAGAGKSYYVREFVKRYNEMFPNNPIYSISYLDEDATLDAYKKIKRIKAFDNEFLNNCMKLDLKTEFKNTFVIFDDIDSVANKKVKDVIYGFLFKLLKIGRLEKQQLGDKVTCMISELDVLDKYNSEIRLNYNYKHTTMSSKRSSTTYSNANTSLYDDDDDI